MTVLITLLDAALFLCVRCLPRRYFVKIQLT